MTYEQVLSTIHSLDKFGSRPGLERINELFSMLDSTLLEQKFIHVAGTNGKGSTCQMISNVLVSASYKVGLFISPYITDFCERIQINNEMISHDMLVDAVEHIYPLVEKLNEKGTIITEFEFITAVALYIYKQQSCDIIVCETGLGGLLDSTNLIKKPLCSVLTKIDIDHTAVLGDTIEQITKQKCGIIKDDSITITASQDECVLDIIKDTANSKNNTLYLADDITLTDVSTSLNGADFVYNDTTIHHSLVGEHQVDNAKVALCTLQALSENGRIDITNDDIKNGFLKATNPARFEVLSHTPLVVLDGAHNVNGMTAFKNAAKRYSSGKRVLLIGMLCDKEIDKALSVIEGLFDVVVCTDVPSPRNLDCYKLSDIMREHFSNVVVQSDSHKAFDTAYEIAKDNSCSLFVAGSLYLAGEIREHIIDKCKK